MLLFMSGFFTGIFIFVGYQFILFNREEKEE